MDCLKQRGFLLFLSTKLLTPLYKTVRHAMLILLLETKMHKINWLPSGPEREEPLKQIHKG